MYRNVEKITKGKKGEDGAGVKLVRVLALDTVKEFDPFLMLDVFDSTNPRDYVKGFPWHPHRGIETVTYLSQGKIEHSDNLGNRGAIQDGCCQWMTAGSGIIHQEMPIASEKMLGFQLWLNLPKGEKMCDPKYHDIKSEDVPEIKKDGATIKVISGKYEGTDGAFQGEYVKAGIFSISMEKSSSLDIKTNQDETVFAYIFRGKGCFSEKDGGDFINEKNAVLFGTGDKIKLKSGMEGMDVVVFKGKPLKEPIAWGGPIVMNTREELNTAFREIDEGKFIKKGKIVSE